MISGKKVVAIIPARAGSKRLKNKNKLKIGGKSLVDIAINTSEDSSFLDQIILTSDDDEVLSKAYGDKVSKVERPSELASDNASTIDVVKHSLEEFSLLQDEIVILLQPTSPLRTTDDIDNSLIFYQNKRAESVISVSETDHSPLWCNTLEENLEMNNFLGGNIENIRSQDLPTYYRINGAIYITTCNQIISNKKFITSTKSYAFVMDKLNSIDIDNELDYTIAKVIYNSKS
tara:strand:- start:93 stop:788 length:696 start_codon:yes stop_codon:yes gene_type:complete